MFCVTGNTKPATHSECHLVMLTQEALGVTFYYLKLPFSSWRNTFQGF